MGEPQQNFPEGFQLRLQKTSSMIEIGNRNGFNKALPKSAPRLLYGNTPRFDMVKGSIAARKATAAAVPKKAGGFPVKFTESSPPNISSANEILAPAGTSALTEGVRPQNDSREDTLEETSLWREYGEGKTSLGPVGSFNELPKVSSAADLIRTASHDRSFHSVSQARRLQQANVKATYSEITHTGYYRPSDRIARLYTSTAAALTSTSAQSVAKAAAALAVAAGPPASSSCGQSRARGTTVGGKIVTAPFAAESREILQALALQPASSREAVTALLSKGLPASSGREESPSPTSDKVGVVFRSPQGSSQHSQAKDEAKGGVEGEEGSSDRAGIELTGSYDYLCLLPSSRLKEITISSAQETRTQLREKRSPPRGKRTLEAAPSNMGELTGGGYVPKDFRWWNPASLDDDVAVQSGSTEGFVGADGQVDRALVEAKKQNNSIGQYWAAVNDRIAKGSPNALGAGAKSPIYALPPVRIERGTSIMQYHCDVQGMVER